MGVSKRAVAGASVLLAFAFILIATGKHNANIANSADVLVTVDKYGIPVSEDEDGVSATEMEQTDLLMLHTVQQLESKVNSLSQQMKQVTDHRKSVGVASASDSDLKDKVKALSTSMLDTIEAVQHLSAQVSNLELQKQSDSSGLESPTVQPDSDTASFITSTSPSSSTPSLPEPVLSVKSGAAVSSNTFMENSNTLKKRTKQNDVSTILSRLASDIAMASAAVGKEKKPKKSQQYDAVEPEKQTPNHSDISALQSMIAQASLLLQSAKETAKTRSSQTTNSGAAAVSPTTPTIEQGHSETSITQHRSAIVQPAGNAVQASSAKIPEKTVIAYDAPSTFSSDLLSDSLGSTELKEKVAQMQAQVKALARRERSTLNALPAVESEISRDRAVLSDGLQSLEIAQDRLVLATKDAEEIGAGPAAIATKAVAEQREAAIQAEVTAELHRLAQAKRTAVEGPRLARTLHQRRAQLRRLESELQRATLLEKARTLESTKDFAG